MKLKLFSVLIFCLFTIILLNCEKDDICPNAVEKTPKLRIEFRDLSNQDNAKAVGKLRIIGIGNDKLVPLESESPSNINLPLKTNTNSTQFVLHKDYNVDDKGTPDDTKDDVILGNKDTLTINYTLVNKYVSRACGFRTVYDDVDISITKDDDNWIRLAKPVEENQTIDNEKNVHFYIYH